MSDWPFIKTRPGKNNLYRAQNEYKVRLIY